jgi:hypothetical protein
MHLFAPVRRTATVLITAGIGAAGFVGLATPAQAQAWAYPSFQQSHVVDREFNFAVATSDGYGTSFLAQWREAVVPGKQQFSVDAGLAAGYGNVVGFFGGTYAVQFISQNPNQPLELLGALGANVAFGSGGTLFRVPVSVSLGHRFPLQGDMAITPYVHPDIGLGICSDCGSRGGSDADVSIGIGFGANFEVTRQVALRLDTNFGSSTFGASDAVVGFGVAWSPMGLRKPPQ